MKIYPMPVEMKSGCLLYSFAMILETEPEVLIKELGHDGMKKKWPELPEPYCYQSFHIQEMIDLCLRRGLSCTEIHALALSLPPSQAYMHMKAHNVGHHFVYSVTKVKERFKDHLEDKKAVLYGQTSGGVTHAWAWDGTYAHDPRSGFGVEPLSNLKIQQAWLILEIK